MQKPPSHICMNPNLMEPSSTSPLFYHVENFLPHHLWQGEVPILIPGVLHRQLFVVVHHQDADHHHEDMAGRTEAISIHTGHDPCPGHALRGGTEAVQGHTHPDRVHHQDAWVGETALDAMEWDVEVQATAVIVVTMIEVGVEVVVGEEEVVVDTDWILQVEVMALGNLGKFNLIPLLLLMARSPEERYMIIKYRMWIIFTGYRRVSLQCWQAEFMKWDNSDLGEGGRKGRRGKQKASVLSTEV